MSSLFKKGINDLETWCKQNNREDILSLWSEENGSLKPCDVYYRGKERVWWECPTCGYKWQTFVVSKIVSKYSCPQCAREKVLLKSHKKQLEKSGTLESKRPDLVSEWNYERNELTPSDYAPQSNKRVWWICRKGHEWRASINSRFRGVGCPKCNKEKGTSFPEQTIFFYLSKVTKTENRFDYDGFEIDIYLPSLNVGIEYDGIHFHSSEKTALREQKKNEYLKSKGVRLIRIKEINDKTNISIENDIIYYPFERDYRNIDLLINYLSSLFELGIKDVDHNRDRSKIYEQYILSEKENSIATKCPELLKEWDFDKNGKLDPYYFRYSSNHKAWWKCNKGHSWQAIIYSRYHGNGCPYCSNNLLLKGFNDLKTLNPTFMVDWDYDKNNDINPSDILGFPQKKVWWKCHTCGYEWEATIDKRGQGRGCPKCKNELGKRKRLDGIIIEKGSIAETHPELLKEWDYERNGGLNPNDFSAGSGKRVWWICSKCGKSWETIIKNRTSGHGCPHCSGTKGAKSATLKRIANKGSFADNHSNLLLDWDYSKNTIDPKLVTEGCTNKVWWKCHVCGHEWEATIVNRSRGRNCPRCAMSSRGLKRSKKVKNIEDDLIFDSLGKAAQHYQFNPDLIGKACKTNKPYKGYHWKFVE